MASVRRNSPGQLSKGQRVIRLVDCSTGEPFEGERIGLEIEGRVSKLLIIDETAFLERFEIDLRLICGTIVVRLWFECSICVQSVKVWNWIFEFCKGFKWKSDALRVFDVFSGENEMYWTVRKKFESDSYHIFFKYPTSRGRIEQRQSEHSLSGFRYFEYTENLW